MPDGRSSEGGGWLRAVALTVVTALLSILDPAVLVAIPFVLLAVFLPERKLATLALALVGVLLTMTGGSGDGLWYLERGWGILLGGWFLALTLRWPRIRFLPRGLGAVAGAFFILGAVFLARPGDWAVVSWMVTLRMEAGLAAATEALRVIQGSGGLTDALQASAARAVSVQKAIFPALVGLASLSALGLGWWLYVRITQGRGDGLGALRDFRFHDHLVWVFIVGLGVLLGASGSLERVGTNAVVFMGALYALRGMAVVLFITGGVSFLGAAFLVAGFLLVAPLLLAGALVVGLGDTWFDLRGRFGTASAA